jgi:hypothetical protein
VTGTGIPAGDGAVERFRLRDHDLVWRQVEDEIIILDLGASLYASLNDAGRVLWMRLVDGATLAELAAELQHAYELAPDVAARDAAAFLARLNDQGLLGP